MAKFPQKGGPAGMAGLLKQAQKMQEDMAKAQAELMEMEFEATAGGGAVKVVLGGDKLVRSVAIEPDVVDPEDVEMLCDMLTAAFNEALRKVDETTQNKMGALAGGMKLPGM